MNSDSADHGGEEGRVEDAGRSTGIGLLNPEEQKEYYKKILDNRIDNGKIIGDTAHTALKEAIKKTTDTQTVIIILNVFMFIAGIALIWLSVNAGDNGRDISYGVLYGVIGFVTVVSSFFVGSIWRSQNTVTDLVQVEIAFLNYFEQVNLWEQYAVTRESDIGINKENIEKASEHIDTCAKDMLELLQKYNEIRDK